jgi:hypothetical protein
MGSPKNVHWEKYTPSIVDELEGVYLCLEGFSMGITAVRLAAYHLLNYDEKRPLIVGLTHPELVEG